MASFTEFLSTLDADTNRRGKQFERFIKWFLKNDPEWATQVEDVWLWDEYPGRWGPDCGIDLVFKSKIGKTWAVQAKCYSADYDISKNDVDTFLSESNRKLIDHRLLIATTDRLGANARQVLDAQEKPVVRYLLSHFESAAVDFPTSVESLSAGKRKPPPKLNRPHQIEAVDAVLAGFETASRGQLIMACGTGKTFVCLWVKERLKAKRTLVLVPSLGLLSQVLSEWTFAARQPFDALCICSDQTVSRKDDDEAVGVTSELPFPVTNDVNEIAEFMHRNGDQVIFSTYQSSPLIAEAQEFADVPRFDLVIADEAHRCAGKSDTVFGTVLNDALIKSDRRLFATATPRVYRTSLKKAAEEFGVEVVDMNDESRFGKRFHTLTFGEAIKREQLTDYRVLIVGVDNERAKEWIENRRLVATDTGLATDARSLAAQIGLLKAIKDWNLRRLISFHGRVKGARMFSEDIVQVAEWLDDTHKPSGNLRAEYVSGEMATILRKQKLSRLKNVGNGDIGLLSNARCLSEGVDVPALDGVAFIDPRSSEIDIIQSVGRAIRLSENKKMGTIVIPVFIEQTDNAEEALKASEFKPIWDVLEALKSHDERLSNELDQLRIELGSKVRRSIETTDLSKIVFDLPTTVNENFARSLRSRLVEKTTESWMFAFGLLQRFSKEHGHCVVPVTYRTDGGYSLRNWSQSQRSNRSRIDRDRCLLLESLPGWTWDPHEEAWKEGFDHLLRFLAEQGHTRVPSKYISEDGYGLNVWVGTQRRFKDRMASHRRERLEALPGWSWAPALEKFEVLWEVGFGYLKKYCDENGHCRVPADFEADKGYKLGNWVGIQRRRKSAYENPLSVEAQLRLEALPGWTWAAVDLSWESNFTKLREFSEREGHCRLSFNYTTSEGDLLGHWVRRQRDRFRRGVMDSNRQKRLEELPGWDWKIGEAKIRTKPRETDGRWEERFAILKAFSVQYGHSKVPIRFKADDGFSLGIWVRSQRIRKVAPSPVELARQQRLAALPGWSWSVKSDKWESDFSRLKLFSEREGHSRVPNLYMTDDGFRLGRWSYRQKLRYHKKLLNHDRQQRLESLRGWVWKIENRESLEE